VGDGDFLAAPATAGACIGACGRHELAIFCVDGQAHAIEDSCPHSGASLCLGPLEGHTVQCRAHGLRFDLRTGAQAGCPQGLQARVYPLRVEGDDVQAQLSS